MPSAQGAGSTRSRATAPPLRFGTGLVTPEQSGGGRLERAQARQPTTWQRHHAATEHLSRTASRRGGKRYERGNLKSRIACRRPLYNTRAKRGSTGGKVRFPPVRHVHSVHQRIKHIPIGWQSTLRRADTAGRGIRTNTDEHGLIRTLLRRRLRRASSSLLLFISIPACPPVRPGCRGRVSLPASRTVPILCSRGRRLPGSPWHGLPVPDPHSAF